MVKKTSNEVFDLIQERGPMGCVLEIINNSPIIRMKESFSQIKEKLLLFPQGMVDVDIIQQQLQQIIKEDVVVLVAFQKEKNNGKIEKIRVFKKGFYYYIGQNPEHLSKVYIHWEEEKKNILDNIDCLKNKQFFIRQDVIDCVPSVFCANIFLYNSFERNVLEGRISLYLGYKI